MSHALSAPLQGGICFFRPLNAAPPSACLTVGLPCIATWRSDDVSTFRVIVLTDNLGAAWTPVTRLIPCRYVRNLQPGHACKLWETCLRPLNSGRSVAQLTARAALRLISPYCPALALNRMEFPEGFSCHHSNPIRYIVREASHRLHSAYSACSRRALEGILQVIANVMTHKIINKYNHLRSGDFVSRLTVSITGSVLT
jgi:hypothetical protein